MRACVLTVICHIVQNVDKMDLQQHLSSNFASSRDHSEVYKNKLAHSKPNAEWSHAGITLLMHLDRRAGKLSNGWLMHWWFLDGKILANLQICQYFLPPPFMCYKVHGESSYARQHCKMLRNYIGLEPEINCKWYHELKIDQKLYS